MDIQIKTLTQTFTFNLGHFQQQVEQNYGLVIIDGFQEAKTGYMNINFPFESNQGKKMLRVFGEYNEFTFKEQELLHYLEQQGVLVAKILPSKEGFLLTKYGQYVYAVFDFIEGGVPNSQDGTYFNVGQHIAKLQEVLKKCDIAFNRKNRFWSLYDRKYQLNKLFTIHKEDIHKFFTSTEVNAITEQIRLFNDLSFENNDIQLVHGDIFDANLLQNDSHIYILDFEYISQGPSTIDALSYVAWNCAKYVDGIATLDLEAIRHYIRGFTTVKSIPTDHFVDICIILNAIDSIFNLEKALISGNLGYSLYEKNYAFALEFINKRKEIEKLLENS